MLRDRMGEIEAEATNRRAKSGEDAVSIIVAGPLAKVEAVVGVRRRQVGATTERIYSLPGE